MNQVSATQEASRDLPWAFVWSQYRIWAKTSRKLSEELRAWRKISVVLVILSAVMGLTSQQIVDPIADFRFLEYLPEFLGSVAGIAIALAAFAKETKLSAEKESHWIRARATAEALKAEVYLFLGESLPKVCQPQLMG